MEQSNKDKIIKAIKAGKSVKHVAEAVGYAPTRMRYLLKQWNVSQARKRHAHIPMPSREELKRKYQKHNTVHKLAEAEAVSVDTVRKWLKALKIPMGKLSGSDEERTKILADDIESIKNLKL